MKKYTILLMLCLAFSYIKAQTILVNSNVISVHEDVAFPFWLDSMSTIEIGTQVVSISALEFNIVPATNGNSLVFSQTKTITSQETVPNGMTWKITAVLLDSTAVNNSSSSGGGQVIVSGSGGNMPVALSEEATSTMDLTAAMTYCDSLQEGGYDNWVVPTHEELMFSISGGISFTDIRTANHLWTTSQENGSGTNLRILSTTGSQNTADYQSVYYVRCVRHESISVSGSGSSSGGSNSTSGVGGGNMPVALSEQSINVMNMGDAMLYCDSLQEDGYDNWVVPTLEELMFVAGGGGSIPGVRTFDWLWSITPTLSGNTANYILTIRLGDGVLLYAPGSSIINYIRCVRHESISVSGSGSSSSGSNTASTLGSGMPTMISLEQPNMEAKDGIIYCDALTESGYDDWVMPTIDQLSYALSGGCVIPDTRTSNLISSRTALGSGDIWYMTADGSGYGIGQHVWWGNYSGTFNKCIRCVR